LKSFSGIFPLDLWLRLRRGCFLRCPYQSYLGSDW
jgi:hypothetical protein